MAAVIKQELILRSLSHGDVSSNELFYHNPYLTKYTTFLLPPGVKGLSTSDIDSTNDTWIKELSGIRSFYTKEVRN